MKKIDKLFIEDEIRTKIARRGDPVQLKKSYSGSLKMKNPNTPMFWDEKLSRENSGFNDTMTQDRVEYAVKLVPNSIKELLDMGVGQGYFTKEVKRKIQSVKIFGVDISLEGLKEIKDTIPGNYFVASALSLPFKKKKKFDLISIFEVLEHISYNHTFRVLAQIKNLLKNKGILLASVPINENYTSRNNPNGHLRKYSKELFIAELKLAGFKVIRYKEFFAFSNLYNLKKILAKLLPNRWKPNLILIEAVTRK